MNANTESINGKQLLLDALNGKSTPRPAWLPFVGVHGGKLIDKNAEEYLTSADNLVAGLTKADELYKPDGLPIIFDLQLEAEVLGCALKWAQSTPPSVCSHPMSVMEGEGLSLEQLPEFSLENGRFPMVFEALDRMKASMGDRVALYGLITGPFTLTMHLLGNDLFLEMYDNEQKIKDICTFSANIGKQIAAEYIKRGADVIALVDPMTSQISPEHFTQYVTPAVNDIFDEVHRLGGLGSMFVCGDATRNLEVMADTNCDNISIDEQIPLDKIGGIARERGKSFGGNMKLTTVLLMGDTDDAKVEAISCMDTAGDNSFVLAPGCDLPYDVKVENLQAVAELVHDPYQRDVARTMTGKEMESFDDIVLPDYASEAAVIVDVITLDSAACAPCQYMVGAANAASEAVGEGFKIQVREHKITNREGVGMMVKLGVGALPSICIDGEWAFSSIIPDKETLTEKLIEAARNKPLGV